MIENIDEQDLDIAITLGASLCKELGVCCEKEGKVIYKIYQKLQETHAPHSSTGQTETEAEPPQ